MTIKEILKWPKRAWAASCRRIDMEILWPEFKRQSRDMDTAKVGFAIHAMNDHAWMILGEDAVIAFIDRTE